MFLHKYEHNTLLTKLENIFFSIVCQVILFQTFFFSSEIIPLGTP